MYIKHALLLFLAGVFLLQSCEREALSDIANDQISFPQNLSDYNIYEGNPNDLVPTAEYHEYKLASALFTDYAEKQRLIKVPAGTQMEKMDNGLPLFPDGTVIVKTFYYFYDKGNPAQGQRVIETRLLVKESGKWNVADYVWNDSQTEATLIEDGLTTTVNYVDEDGEPQVLAYQIPSNRACATCHNLDEQLTPIGPKLRNMNKEIETETGTQNQLAYFQSLNILDPFDHNMVLATPNFEDESLPIETRGRAYLDANCAHCHNDAGFAAEENLFLDYELPYDQTNISNNKWEIGSNMEDGTMPHIGTTVLDTEGIALIQEYVNAL